MKITQEERRRLLAEAIAAVRALREDTTPPEPGAVRSPSGQRLHAKAVAAVTKAVTTGGHLHTLISAALSMPGMHIVNLIEDRDARAKALVVERHAAQRYTAEVLHAIKRMAVSEVRQAQADPQRTGTPAWKRDETTAIKAPVAKKYNITRRTLDAWLAEAEADAARDDEDGIPVYRTAYDDYRPPTTVA